MYAPYGTQFEPLYSAGNALGITFVASSGDYGSNGCDNGPTQSGVYYTFPCAQNPASSPQVTGVGGTSLVAGSSASTGLSGTSNSGYVSENAWPFYLSPDEYAAYTGNPPTAGGAWGSGGGVSMWFFQKPAYQNLVATGYGARTVPDVAGMMGTLGAPAPCPAAGASCISAYYLVQNGAIQLIYGTSGSSPTFTGILALWQQYEGSSQIGRRLRSTASVPAGGVRFGNVNPALYAAYAAERGPKAAALAKVGLPPVNVSQTVAAKAASAVAGKPDWAASKILNVAAEVTAVEAKVAAKKVCVTQGSAAGPLAEKVKLCKFNDDIPGSNGVYASGDGAGEKKRGERERGCRFFFHPMKLGWGADPAALRGQLRAGGRGDVRAERRPRRRAADARGHRGRGRHLRARRRLLRGRSRRTVALRSLFERVRGRPEPAPLRPRGRAHRRKHPAREPRLGRLRGPRGGRGLRP